MTVTVALPVRNGGPLLADVLRAVRAQELDREVELLVADSASTDGSAALAATHGARVLAVRPGDFSHGGTRDLLMREARGTHVAFLTQDALPAGPGWLAALLGGFAVAEDVALAFGPYLPAPDASPIVARELREWFASFGGPRVDRLGREERDVPARALLGPRAFFTDANGCVLRAAWERVPFRPAPYAEDHLLALDMLRAGWAKAYVPEAGVVHSHDLRPAALVRRAFDEARALREVYDYVEPATPARARAVVLGRARAEAPDGPRAVLRALGHHALRFVGSLLGSRADRLRPATRRRLSLEGRASFVPADPRP